MMSIIQSINFSIDSVILCPSFYCLPSGFPAVQAKVWTEFCKDETNVSSRNIVLAKLELSVEDSE